MIDLFTPEFDVPLNGSEKFQMISLLEEQQDRRAEAMRLYEPMPLQNSFHQSRTYIRLYIGGNRAGKSVATAMEFARAVLGQDPFHKYPKTGGKIYVVGKSLKHCADTIYPLLFHPGAFKIIVDEYTEEWRVFRPWDSADKLREKEALPAPPIVPERFVADVGWKSRSKQEIDRVLFTTGWEALFFSAEGQHPQGSSVDIVWFDEEIQKSKKDGDWFPEMSARLIDKGGVLIWSAAPQKGYQELYDLYERGNKQLAEYKLDPAKYKKPDIEIFHTKQEDNVFLSAENRAKFLQNLSAEQAAIRSSGEFSIESRLVYPEFNLATHGYGIEGDIPPHWTRYVYFDPGHAIGAALFIACPPPKECENEEPMALAYDEIYVPQCNAVMLAQAMKLRSDSQQFEAFIIDMHGARPHEAGSGLTVYEQYEEEFRDLGVFSKKTGSGFWAGSDDRKAGVMRGHQWLARRRKDGTSIFDVPPRFRVATNKDRTVSRVPNFVYEMKRYPKKVIGNVVTDEANDRGATHLCQCFRYCVMSSPEYLQVKMVVNQRQAFRSWFDQMVQDQSGTSGTPYLSLGRSP